MSKLSKAQLKQNLMYVLPGLGLWIIFLFWILLKYALILSYALIFFLNSVRFYECNLVLISNGIK